MNRILVLCVLVLVAVLSQMPDAHWNPFSGSPPSTAPSDRVDPAGSTALSAQEQALETTLRLIRQGGPFPHDRDGIVFHNRERLLPIKPHGYYREYTVDTPGLSHRGPRRVVTGGDPPEVFYYTEDHYQSFVQIEGR